MIELERGMVVTIRGEDECINTDKYNVGFVRGMHQYCGKEATITRVMPSGNSCHLTIDGGEYLWTKEWLTDENHTESYIELLFE